MPSDKWLEIKTHNKAADTLMSGRSIEEVDSAKKKVIIITKYNY